MYYYCVTFDWGQEFCFLSQTFDFFFVSFPSFGFDFQLPRLLLSPSFDFIPHTRTEERYVTYAKKKIFDLRWLYFLVSLSEDLVFV